MRDTHLKLSSSTETDLINKFTEMIRWFRFFILTILPLTPDNGPQLISTSSPTFSSPQGSQCAPEVVAIRSDWISEPSIGIGRFFIPTRRSTPGDETTGWGLSALNRTNTYPANSGASTTLTIFSFLDTGEQIPRTPGPSNRQHT